MPPVSPPAYDLAPLLWLALFGALLALGPLTWVWHRHRHEGTRGRLKALTVLTLFLTFDLVLFGAFTRLTDSGLGCPDWPGCYGNATPLGAHAEIHAAQSAMPSGPVTHGKAWVEMTHRYLATAVGALTTVLMGVAWVERWRRRTPPASLRWPTFTWLWTCMQGAFGALTVTMKLYPAIVTAHLLGGLGLLMLLAVQKSQQQAAADGAVPLRLSRGLWVAVWAVLLLSLLQATLGGWVSTNYAVLICTDFPTCQGQWWPPMDFAQGFTVLRPLGLDADGAPLSFAGLTAIHFAHRLGAGVLLTALLALAWRLHASGEPALRRWGWAFAGVALWQLASGLSNVVLGWPMPAALAHTGGAAALLALLAALLGRAAADRRAPRP